MFQRQRTGSVVCPSCGRLVGINDEKCFNCGRPRPGMWGFAPLLRKLGQDLGFVELMIGACGLLFLATLVSDTSGMQLAGGGLFSFLSPSRESLLVFGASGAYPVIGAGRWWTLLSAGWLHAGLLHILFNVLWIRQLAPAVAEAFGPARMVIIYVLAGAVGFAFSSFGPVYVPLLGFLLGGPGFTVGASAPIFGLLGALVLYGRRVSSQISRQVWTWAAILFALGLLWRGVDNWAHLGGFLGGLGVAAVLDPRKPERTDHVVVALVLLLVSAASIFWSVWTGVKLLR